jgi:hypothetical protein
VVAPISAYKEFPIDSISSDSIFMAGYAVAKNSYNISSLSPCKLFKNDTIYGIQFKELISASIYQFEFKIDLNIG